MEQLLSSPLVSRTDDDSPLVCDSRGRLYLQRLYRHEQRLAALLRHRALAERLSISEENYAPIGRLLNRYFGDPHPDALPDWQKIAAVVCLLKRLCIISGAPGTGKTTTVAKMLVAAGTSVGSHDL